MSDIATPTEQIPVRVFGGLTALFPYGSLCFRVDPTSNAPRNRARPGPSKQAQKDWSANEQGDPMRNGVMDRCLR